MSAKQRSRNNGGLVYSTNPDYYHNSLPEDDHPETLPKERQRLQVKLDTKQRAGKVVTLVSGFTGSTENVEALGKQLKTRCGTGGSVKDGQIIIQGDYRQKIVTWLKEWGYVLTKG